MGFVEKITYRQSKEFTDSELIEYLSSSSFWVGDEEHAREMVQHIREHTKILIENEEKSKSLRKFKKFRKPNLMHFYEEVIHVCMAQNCYCPFLLFQDVESPSADSGFLILPYDIELEAVISLIEETTQTNSEAFAKTFDPCDSHLFCDIYDTTLDICKYLEIESPYVTLLTGSERTGGWAPNEDTIYVNMSKTFGSREALIMTLAHELRHKWQTISGGYIDDSDYYVATELDTDIRGQYDMEEAFQKYSLQECEVDANAFAYAYSIKAGYNAQTIDQLMKRHHGVAYEEIVERAKKITI